MQTFLTRYQIKLPQIGLAILLYLIIFIEIVTAGICAMLKIQQSFYLSYLFPIFLAMTLTLWVHYDALSLRKSMLGMAQGIFIFCGWPVMFPIYVLESRGIRSGSVLLLTFFGLFILTLISAIITTITLAILITLLNFSR